MGNLASVAVHVVRSKFLRAQMFTAAYRMYLVIGGDPERWVTGVSRGGSVIVSGIGVQGGLVVCLFNLLCWQGF